MPLVPLEHSTHTTMQIQKQPVAQHVYSPFRILSLYVKSKDKRVTSLHCHLIIYAEPSVIFVCLYMKHTLYIQNILAKNNGYTVNWFGPTHADIHKYRVVGSSVHTAHSSL